MSGSTLVPRPRTESLPSMLAENHCARRLERCRRAVNQIPATTTLKNR